MADANSPGTSSAGGKHGHSTSASNKLGLPYIDEKVESIEVKPLGRYPSDVRNRRKFSAAASGPQWVQHGNNPDGGKKPILRNTSGMYRRPVV